MTIARFYDETKNADGAYIPGVPLRDLTAEEFDALPKHLQAGVDALPFYRKTRPPSDAPAATRSAAPARTRARRSRAAEPPTTAEPVVAEPPAEPAEE